MTEPDLSNGGRGLVVDCFAGPGGWSTGMAHLGIADIGIEWNPSACQTRAAAGHTTIRADVSQVPTEPFRGKVWGLVSSPPCQSFSMAGTQKGKPTALLDALAGKYDPQAIRADIARQQAALDAWDSAWRAVADERGWFLDLEGGVQTGISLPGPAQSLLDPLSHAAEDSDGQDDPAQVIDLGPEPGSARRLSERGVRERDAEFGPAPDVDDERGMFMAEIVRWVKGTDPTWVACEQVPPVAPLFALIVPWLRERGYSAWSGILNSADYGVPQTRKRAILMASKDRTVAPPEATHCQGGSTGEDLFGGSLAPWVSMASALGWDVPADEPDPATVKTNASMRPDGRTTEFDAADRPAPTFTGWSGLQWEMPDAAAGGDPRRGVRVWADPAVELLDAPARPVSPVGLPCLVNNTTANAAARTAAEPAPTMFFGERLNTVTWRFTETPAVAGMADRAASDNALSRSSGPRTDGVQAVVRISTGEAAVLQSFPPDYPFQGTRSAKFLQIGDAVPPRLAWHVIRALTCRR